ncbi:MAG: hypothetical protein D8M58_00665 [Calditrichaeota bacterium]|nr:MAG: hypothetical protein DWQ03_06415 [Calditrichota bacterium]MBL1203882.1 hypothetical protein [Calditrichota bacterium]NOG43714.1 hypothetical protein [Calditrichota bacterium]
MKLYGGKDHRISIDYARELTRNFRAEKKTGESISGLFDKETVLAVLNQQDCIAMRYYHGINEEDKNVIVIVGVDKHGYDILDGVIIEKAFPCPPFCGDINDLNADDVEEKRLAV